MFDNNDENYSGDYIRPTEEYRSDCEDYHEHGITYENHDDEQHAYDRHNEAEGQFTGVLMNGEHILWAGTGKGSAPGAAIGVIFAIFWLGFAVFWTIGATVAGGIFGAFGIPFILVGIFLFKNMLVPNKKYYAITNMRILSKNGKRLSAERLDRIANISVGQTSGNRGYVTYHTTGAVYYRGNNHHTGMMTGLYGIENPNEVYRILNDAVYMNNNLK